MFDSKGAMKGFLEYLQSYYGGKGKPYGTKTANLTKMPLFSSFPDDMPDIQPQDPMMQQGMGGGMGEEFGAEALNGMFPGPYDPMRMN